jgi:hypothetical protein
MNVIKCSFPDCQEKIETSEPVSPNAQFICRFHTGPDTRNKVRFQMHQFDKALGGRKPVGTNHIPNRNEQ